MVTTNDKIILWWLTNRKHTNKNWLDKKRSCTPQNDVHTSEDILTKMIKKFPLTLNFFWVVYFQLSISNLLFSPQSTMKSLDSVPAANLNECLKRLRRVANQPEPYFEADDTVMRWPAGPVIFRFHKVHLNPTEGSSLNLMISCWKVSMGIV